MNYRITKKSIGTNVKKVIGEVETVADIVDTCLISNEGILFIERGASCIRFVDFKGKSMVWLGEPANSTKYSCIKNPSSICHNGRFGYVLEDGAETILKFSLKHKNVESFSGKSYSESFKRYAKVSLDSKINSVAVRSGLFFTVDNLNRCFFVFEGRLNSIYGDGRARFSVSNEIQRSSFNHPTGLFVKGGDIYISDTNNSCVRKICKDRKTLSVFAGAPLGRNNSSLDRPSKIVIEKGLALVQDGNSIKMVNPQLNTYDKAFESEDLHTFNSEGRFIYVWEKYDE